MGAKTCVKGIIWFMAVVLMISLAGCSVFESPEARRDRELAQIEQEAEDLLAAIDDDAQQDAEDAEKTITSTASIKDMYLLDSSNFSEGRAWVQYQTEISYGKSAQGYAMINRQGDIVWKYATDLEVFNPVDSSHNDDWMIYPSDFKDGLAYFYSNSGFSIIDLDGTVTYTDDQGQYHLLGYGDGKFLVAQYISDLDTNEWHIGAIDKSGNIVVPLQACEALSTPDDAQEKSDGGFDYADTEELPPDEGYRDKLAFDAVYQCTYLGSNVFYLYLENGTLCLNIETHRVVLNGDDLADTALFTDFSDGYALISVGDLYSYNTDSFTPWRGKYETGLYQLNSDATVSDKIANAWWASRLEFSDGLTFDDGVFYDIYGNVAIEFPQYQDKYYYCAPFTDGYTVMEITGADGLSYFTVIDHSGQERFKPTADFSALHVTNGGNHILAQQDDGIAVLDMNGTPVMTVTGVLGKSSISGTGGMLRISKVDDYHDIYIDLTDGTIMGDLGYAKNKVSITMY